MNKKKLIIIILIVVLLAVITTLLVLHFNKKDTKKLFYKYLEVFRICNGKLDMQIFKYLPLIENFSNKNPQRLLCTFK